MTDFDSGNARSFLFAAVELKDASYSRGDYATFAREVNKRWQIPTVVLFKTSSDFLSLAFVHRRLNRRDPSRDVLGSVSLIREINAGDPHRAHVDILAELGLGKRLRWMDTHGKDRNFDGLLAAWLDALDTEELNRRFYRELKDWFDRAVKEARFPTTGARVLKPEEHVIRLITRMLFVWFIKEKGLVAEDLFVENQVALLLTGYERAEGDSYYRAILQNLFFATLNTEIDRRTFSSQSNATHRDFSCYRYASKIADSDALLAHFARTPFINGGLFDCLDSEEATRDRGYRIDYFSDNVIRKGTDEYSKLSIPNRLFFDDSGLITLFKHYKFTVEENTPAEQEVALDPELLGKVFENLLAAYNPETKENVRKQTGSYYTPRDVVDYMVDEALVASIVQKAASDHADRTWWEDRLRYLLDYNDAGELFLPDEADRIVRAISELRVLDPAVGSGAFPMGVLHKLTLGLRRLDPSNSRWEALQKEQARQRAAAAFDVATQQERDQALDDISETFERYRDSDFGRKLYLIQNSIYGVDIQPVATQIAKLRFFISLAIEQQPTGNMAENYGIQPLPNLETRFVAADTLLGLDKKALQIPLGGQNRVAEINDQLRENRERHFHAGVRQQKLRLRTEDARLRGELATELERAGMSKSDAGKTAAWDPYDQNTQADWFDAGYMFDIRDGFDVVIGNPPYVQLQRDGGRLGNLYRGAGFSTFASTGDVYQLFYERGFSLLAESGVLAYITSNSWLKAEYGKSTRQYVASNHTVLRLLETGKDVFENVIVDTSVLIGRSGNTSENAKAVDTNRLSDRAFPPNESLWSDFRPRGDGPWSVLSPIEQSVMDKMLAVGTPLKDWDIAIYYGIKTGFNDAFIIDNQTKDALIAEDPKSAEIIKPIVRGRDIRRFQVDWKGLWLIATFPALGLSIDHYPAVRKYLLSFGKARLEQSGKRLTDGTKARKKTGNAWYEMQDTCAYHAEFAKEKLFWADMAVEGRFAFSDEEAYCNNKGYIMTGESLKYLCAILNSSLITWWVRNTAATTGMGLTEWTIVTVGRLPIPKVSSDGQIPFVRLVDRVLQAADTGEGDTMKIEADIDSLVNELYGLTGDEIRVTTGK